MGRQLFKGKAPCPPKGELRFVKVFYVWNYSKGEVEDLKPGFVMKHRSLPFGKGGGGLGLDVDNCVTSFSSLIVHSLRRTLVLIVL